MVKDSVATPRLVGVSFLLVALGLGSCAGVGPQPATPQRPTVSRNTQTTAKGTIEIEAGVRADPGKWFRVPTMVKLGVADNAELFSDWNVYRYEKRPGEDFSGADDVAVGYRSRLVDETEHGPAVALQIKTQIPTASSDISNGEVDAFFAGVVEKGFGDATKLWAFYELGLIGKQGDNRVEKAHSLAVAGSHQLDDRWGLIGEWSGYINNDGIQNIHESELLGGITLATSPSTVIDFGATIGVSDDAPDWTLFVGMTMNFGSIFGFD